MVLDGKISEVDEKQPEASEEMRKLGVERGQAGSGSAEGFGHCWCQGRQGCSALSPKFGR